MPMNGHDDAADAVDQRLSRSTAAAPTARYRTPFSASGISATMISALKITADRIALRASRGP